MTCNDGHATEDLLIQQQDYHVTPSAQGGYNGHRAVGDLRRQMAGISNICHLHHESWQCDCAITSFRQQTSGK